MSPFTPKIASSLYSVRQIKITPQESIRAYDRSAHTLLGGSIPGCASNADENEFELEEIVMPGRHQERVDVPSAGFIEDAEIFELLRAEYEARNSCVLLRLENSKGLQS